MDKVIKPATDKVLIYMEALPDWSKKICSHLRHIILSADASIIEEWKWGPNYNCHGMVCGYGAFQKHIKLTFFNGSAMKDEHGLFNHCVDNKFSRSIKITTIEEISKELLTSYIRESIAINQVGFKRVINDKTVFVPEELLAALRANKKAFTYFEGLTYGYKKEFGEHVATAKLEKTKIARISKILSLCEEGKTLNHRYKK
jgi:hypothetical protein